MPLEVLMAESMGSGAASPADVALSREFVRRAASGSCDVGHAAHIDAPGPPSPALSRKEFSELRSPSWRAFTRSMAPCPAILSNFHEQKDPAALPVQAKRRLSIRAYHCAGSDSGDLQVLEPTTPKNRLRRFCARHVERNFCEAPSPSP